SGMIPIVRGLGEIAIQYDALFCDVWGVLHNGRTPYLQAADALYRFQAERGPVILLTNAPRPIADVERMFRRLGVPLDCYGAILSSGALAQDDIAQRIRAARRTVRVFHLGPDRDGGILAGLDVEQTDVSKADIVLCTGLFDDETETAENYTSCFEEMKSRELTMLCANPDLIVQRGDRLIWCAGALAEAYEKLGGTVVYYGKPHQPIYDSALRLASRLAAREIRRPLAIGDGADTDVKGANAAGIDALFIAQGVHAAHLGKLTAEGLGQLFVVPEARPKAAMPTLVW
ncbi:MAG: TIGR01459 family HAD-type hydrolase, partial [Alphaproteobacteria bacterium]|nr:TIGR01459 family HAD-type hydrolase [Alphaproteobacteria bacterium]